MEQTEITSRDAPLPKRSPEEGEKKERNISPSAPGTAFTERIWKGSLKPSLFSMRIKKKEAKEVRRDEIKQKSGESLKQVRESTPPQRSPVAKEREEKCL